MRRALVPFLTAPSDAIDQSPWRQQTDDQFVALPAELAHWDYQTDLVLRSEVKVDRDAILGACHLGPGSHLALMVSWHSSHTAIGEVAATEPLRDEPAMHATLEARVHGALAGGRLTIKTSLVVTEAKPLDELAPQQAGDILWSDEQKAQLQGSGAQFPTDAADFALIRPESADAAWELRIDTSDADALFLSAARLTLNTGKPAVARMIGGASDEATRRLQAVLTWDVTRQLVLAGLRWDEVLGRDVDAEGVAVADVLRGAIGRVWPGEDPVIIQGWLARDPSRVERDIQDYAGFVD